MMAKYFGVRCATCVDNIKIEAIVPDAPGTIGFEAIPLEPVACPHCGASHEYGSVDRIEFEAEE